MQAQPNRNNDIESVSLLLSWNGLLLIYSVFFSFSFFPFRRRRKKSEGDMKGGLSG